MKDIAVDVQRRIALLAGISVIGSFALVLFGLMALAQGNFPLGVVDLSMCLILMGNLLYARITKRYDHSINFGITLTSIFYIYLYLNGGINQTAYVWYFTYPLIAVFLLGSITGALFTLIMTIPVIYLLLAEPHHPFFSVYTFDFEIRFLISFLVVGVFAFLIENAAEKYREEIDNNNQLLEETVRSKTVALTKEIEEHKKSQQLLARSEERYRVMFEKSVNAIFLVNRKTGYYIDANPAAERLTGRSKEQLLTMKTSQITPDSAKERLSHLSTPSSSIDMDLVKYIQPDNSVRQTLFNAVQLDGDHVMGIAHDITLLKEAEEEQAKLAHHLQHAKKMEAIGTMAGGVAHDLNNILAGVVSYPGLIRSNLPADSSLIEPLKNIEEAGKRAALVVDDLLTLSRDSRKAFSPVDTHDLTLELINSPEWKNIESHFPGVSLRPKLNAQFTTIDCSEIHISKCLMNLLNNAFEASAPTGTVTISTRNIVYNQMDKSLFPDHLTKLRNAHNILQLTVEDDGPGIASKHLEQIFEPFYTTKKMGKSGTGLGLSIVWNTMSEHGGTVRVSNAHPGAKFDIFLPVVHSKTHQSKSIKEASDSLAGTGTILVVEDEEMLRIMSRDIISKFGYKVMTAENGEEAIEIVKKVEIDLVILDMILGDGINGYETYKFILEHRPLQKALIVSGYSTESLVKETIALGASAIIKKPFTFESLGKGIKKALSA